MGRRAISSQSGAKRTTEGLWSTEALEPRLLLYANGLDQPVHEYITEQAYNFFRNRFGPTELDTYIGASETDYTSGSNSRVIEGAFDEDEGGQNPWGETGIPNGPFNRHFWEHDQQFNRVFDDGLTLYSGVVPLTNFDAAPNRAEKYFSGGYGVNDAYDSDWDNNGTVAGQGITWSYEHNQKPRAYYWLGHVAHLLQDMTVPVHSHGDPHLTLVDDDVYHSYIDDGRWGNWGFPSSAQGNPSPGGEIRVITDLYALFSEVADASDDYDTSDVPSDGPAWKFDGQEDGGQRRAGGFSEQEAEQIADEMMPLAMKATAELFRYFYSLVDTDAPTVTVLKLSANPAAPSKVYATSLDVRATATDSVSGVDKQSFQFVTERLAGSTWVPGPESEVGDYDAKIENLQPGNYRIFAKATDGAGRTGTSAPRYFQVFPASTTATGETVSGAFPIGGSQNFFVNGITGGSFHIVCTETSADFFNPQVKLYAPDGSLVSSNSGSLGTSVIKTGLPQTGSYRVEVTSARAGWGGAFKMTIVHAPSRSDFGDDGGDIASGQTRSGTIGVGDLDTFYFHAGVGESFTVAMARTGGTDNFHPEVSVFAPDGSRAGTVEWDYVGTATGVTGTTQAGVYTIVANRTYEDATGTYNLTLAKLPGPQQPGTGGDGGPIVSDQTRTGTLDAGDLDVYTFEAEAGERIVARLGETGANTDFSPWLLLYGPDGSLISSESDYVGTAAGVAAAPFDGTYYLVVRAVNDNDTGNYEITLAKLDGPQAHNGGDGGTLRSGETVTANLTAGDMDVFTFEAVRGESIVAAMAEVTGNTDFSPWLQIYAPDGTILQSASNYVGTYISIGNAPQTGTYYLLTRAVNDNQVGAYNLTMAKLPGKQQTGGDGGNLVDGSTVGAHLDRGDLDVFMFVAAAGNGIHLTMTEAAGAETSPHLFLYGPDGKIIWSESDYVSASIHVSSAPKTGKYYVLAKDYFSSTAAPYTMSLDLTGLPPTIQSLVSAARDTVHLVRDALDPGKFKAWLDGLGTGGGGGGATSILTGNLSDLAALDFGAGDDSVTLDFTNGSPLPAGATINGGAGLDGVMVVGKPTADVVAFNASSVTLGGSTLNLSEFQTQSFDGKGGADVVTVNDGAHVVFDSTQTLNALTVNGGGNVVIAPGRDKALHTTSLSIADNGRLDLTDNHLIVDHGPGGTPVAAVEAMVKRGFNGGRWTGDGITSSTAAAEAATGSGLTALGVVDNAETGRTAFGGVTGLTGAETLVKLTYYGDADLNGAITLDDFTLFLNGYQTAKTTWMAGNFDYGGSVTLDDFTLFLAGYQRQGPPL
jgi:hypothetical protein